MTEAVIGYCCLNGDRLKKWARGTFWNLILYSNIIQQKLMEINHILYLVNHSSFETEINYAAN